MAKIFKKIAILLSCLALACAFVACGGKNQSSAPPADDNPNNPNNPNDQGPKTQYAITIDLSVDSVDVDGDSVTVTAEGLTDNEPITAEEGDTLDFLPATATATGYIFLRWEMSDGVHAATVTPQTALPISGLTGTALTLRPVMEADYTGYY